MKRLIFCEGRTYNPDNSRFECNKFGKKIEEKA